MTLVVHTNGVLRITLDGDPLGKLPRKAYALLAYVALQPDRVATRHRLAELLWERHDRPRHNLRCCLFEIHATLGSERWLALGLIPEFGRILLREVIIDRAGSGDFLADLDGISKAYDRWLHEMRVIRLDGAKTEEEDERFSRWVARRLGPGGTMERPYLEKILREAFDLGAGR